MQHAVTYPANDAEALIIADNYPIIVDSGPGTGKTTSLVRRIYYLADAHGPDYARGIVVCTFSRHAVNAVKQTYYRLFDKECPVHVSTISKLSIELVNLYIERIFGYNSIYNRRGQKSNKVYQPFYVTQEDFFSKTSNVSNIITYMVKFMMGNKYPYEKDTNFLRIRSAMVRNLQQSAMLVQMSSLYMFKRQLCLAFNLDDASDSLLYEAICERHSSGRKVRAQLAQAKPLFEEIAEWVRDRQAQADDERVKQVDPCAWLGLSYMYYMLTHQLHGDVNKNRSVYIDISLSPLWVSWLSRNEKYNSILRSMYRHFMLDEAQDINTFDYILLDNFFDITNGRVEVYYDIDQSVYRFRGALGREIASACERKANALQLTPRRFHLRTNMRSYTSIVQILNTYHKCVLRSNPDRLLNAWASWPNQELVKPLGIPIGPEGIAVRIAEMIKEIKNYYKENNVDTEGFFKRICIITTDRSHERIERIVRSALEREGIPYQKDRRSTLSPSLDAFMSMLYLIGGEEAIAIPEEHAFAVHAFILRQAVKASITGLPKDLADQLEQVAEGFLADGTQKAEFIYQLGRYVLEPNSSLRLLQPSIAKYMADQLLDIIKKNNNIKNGFLDTFKESLIKNSERISNSFVEVCEGDSSDSEKVISIIGIILNEHTSILPWLNLYRDYKLYVDSVNQRHLQTPTDIPDDWGRTLQSVLDWRYQHGEASIPSLINRLLGDLGLSNEDAVHIMSASAAKGLEFDVVFLILPPASDQDNASIANDVYVGISRAKRWLVMFWDVQAAPQSKPAHRFHRISGSTLDAWLDKLPVPLRDFIENLNKSGCITITSDMKYIKTMAARYPAFSALCETSKPSLPSAQKAKQQVASTVAQQACSPS